MSTTVTQSEFRAALLDGAQDRPLGLTDAQNRAAGRRFDVYRNNVAVSLTEALETGFPAIAKLLGGENFKAIAGMFLRQYPPGSPLMMHYGAEFPDFLSGLEQLGHLGYLGDVARLELALRRAYHAADAPPIAPEALAEIPPMDLADVRLQFAPAVELLCSPWPVHAIWAFNMAKGPKPQAIAQDVLVLRPEFDPEPHALAPGARTCVLALMRGETLGVAAELGAEASEKFDFSGLLTLLLSGNAITNITTKN